MANPNVKKALDRIGLTLSAIAAHVTTYSGVPAADARYIENAATGIAVVAARIAAEARAAQGDRSASGLVKRVRRAFGFINP